METTSRNSVQIPAIEIENLSVKVNRQSIFSGLSLRLDQGQKTTLVGRSGSGKSSLLRALLGFVAPESGTIRIFGRKLTAHSVWELRTHMAYVAQEPEMAAGKVRDVLETPFSFKNNRHLRENLKRIPGLLDRLQLPGEISEKDVTDLSGGERQRIALISALLLDREILLLDEASSALDQAAKHAVIDLLRAGRSLTILSVSHDREWMGFSDNIVELSEPQKEAPA
ncbi:MAG TPA: ATP-binding cassette domain-containing protein [Desulfobacteraceae bacterium]|nr:ATP-binding cassette domain-containing protein [Desulfobacteraceae bacterium]